ncbi:MAG TPA: prepilin-type N-terminal cleavage/methylation domain-containing protein, partial [Candidatus Hydrogenedentes bacterium]|nr:prepilin-type N-terminal cleavage/methylation domain-containing protein [Candidatus Hydrogenedentota bacterium]
MYTGRGWGFTLIELLVVIAIIGILAGFLAVGLPRALELAKIRDVETDFNGIRNAL